MFKVLLMVALVAAAVWYGAKHFDGMQPAKSHEVVVSNQAGKAVERLRISVPGNTVVVEVLEDGASRRLTLPGGGSGPFRLEWNNRGVLGDRAWSGGQFTPGPPLATHRLDFLPDGSVSWSQAPKPER